MLKQAHGTAVKLFNQTEKPSVDDSGRTIKQSKPSKTSLVAGHVGHIPRKIMDVLRVGYGR